MMEEIIMEERCPYAFWLDANSGGHDLFLIPHSSCYFGLHSDDVHPFVEV